MHKNILSLSLTTTLMTGLPAYAEPLNISGEVVMELQNEYTADSDDTATDEHNDLFFRTEVAPTVQLNDHFFIDGVAVLERTQDRKPNKDNWFNNEGIFIEEIKLNYEHGQYRRFFVLCFIT